MLINPLNTELNPICHLLTLLGGATIVVVSRLRVKRYLHQSPNHSVPSAKVIYKLGDIYKHGKIYKQRKFTQQCGGGGVLHVLQITFTLGTEWLGD